MIPMWVVWCVRIVWAMAFLFWVVCLVNFLIAKKTHKEARARILPELEKLK